MLARYTNDINPFGDSNLTEQFVWGKKKEKEGTADKLLTKRDMRDMQKKNIDEIEKVQTFMRGAVVRCLAQRQVSQLRFTQNVVCTDDVGEAGTYEAPSIVQ